MFICVFVSAVLLRSLKERTVHACSQDIDSSSFSSLSSSPSSLCRHHHCSIVLVKICVQFKLCLNIDFSGTKVWMVAGWPFNGVRVTRDRRAPRRHLVGLVGSVPASSQWLRWISVSHAPLANRSLACRLSFHHLCSGTTLVRHIIGLRLSCLFFLLWSFLTVSL